jgi:hypothetical protein
VSALDLVADCAAAGVRLEARGDRIGIVGPPDAVALLRGRIVAAKPDLLALLRDAGPQPDRCARCDGAIWRRSADGSGWCRRCDARRCLLDLAALADFPRMSLSPTILITVPGGRGAWVEFAAHVAAATAYVGARRLRERLGAAASRVAPSDSPIEPWQA